MLKLQGIEMVFKRGDFMAVKREWTDCEKKSLLKHITELKGRGMTVKDAAQEFTRINPHITPGQARVYYYKLISETENFKKKYTQRVWTQEEDDILLEFILQNRDRRKIEMFDILSQKLDRHPKAIASRYYFIKNSSNIHSSNSKNYFETLSKFKFYQFKNLLSKISKIHEIYEKAVELESILQKEKIIAELNRELQEARLKIQILEQKILAS